jgi:dolichol-phosphate mannosyltransferase
MITMTVGRQDGGGAADVIDPIEVSSPLLTVIIPVFNERRTVAELLRRVSAVPISKQIIVVDDGSTDGSTAILESWKNDRGIVLLTHASNLGKGQAIRTGLDSARGVFTIVQDADLEYDPGDYIRLLDPLVSGRADVVLGSRYLNGTHLGVGRFFRLGVSVLNRVCRILYGIKLTDEATCYKVTRSAMLRQMELCCARFEFCPEVIAKACRMGLSIVEIPVHYEPRDKNAGKKIRLSDGFSALRTLWRWRKWNGPAEQSGIMLPPVSHGAGVVPLVPVPTPSGFALVELLVVMGIIVLLIGLLFPVFVRAQQDADRVRCLAALQQIGTAVQLHQSDHRGYLPVGGWQFPSADPPGTGTAAAKPAHIATPSGLHDSAEQHFMYYLDSGLKRPVPITVALVRYLHVDVRLGSREELTADLQNEAIKQMFRCAAQSKKDPHSGFTQRDGADGWTSPAEFSGYVFNEAVLGLRDMGGVGQGKEDRTPPVGNMVRVKYPSTVMFACDGQPRNATTDDWLMVFDKTAEDTLYDFQQRTLQDGWGKDTFDYKRHRNRMNVLFLDGHAETVPMSPGGLKGVGVSKGVYN